MGWKAVLRRHIAHTPAQHDRLEEALSAMGGRSFDVEGRFLGFVGNIMALGHLPTQDEILKNTFANHAFENFEIAADTSLLTIGGAAGQGAHRSAFERSPK